MSEKDRKKSNGFAPPDEEMDDDYYFDEPEEYLDDEIGDDDIRYLRDREPKEGDTDYFLDEGDETESETVFREVESDRELKKEKTVRKEAGKSHRNVKGKNPDKKASQKSLSQKNSEKKLNGELFQKATKQKCTEKASNRKVSRTDSKGKAAQKASGKKPKQKKDGKRFFIGIGVAVIVLASVYVGMSFFFMTHFLMNTEINGHDFSAKTISDVEKYIESQVDGYQLTVQEKDGKSDVILGTDISLKYRKNSEIEKILEKQNAFTWPASIFRKKSEKTMLEMEYDENALDERIQNLQAVTAEQTPSVSACPKFDGTQFVVAPEVIGTAVNMEKLEKEVKQHIQEFQTELDMEKTGCYETPKYTSASEEVKKACDTMNQYCKASITYTMTENEVVDATVISGWLTVDADMNVTFNENGIREWLTAFGDKYDTVGTTRTITSPDGRTVEVNGGTYGWSIDEDTEFEALKASIKNGETVTKEPAYYQTAASHSATDWGNTYAEVDLTTQRMWYIVDGVVALSSDVVTGYPTPDKETPAGVYSILEMQLNKTLIGEIVPETGKPEYETPVDYWMRITWSGIGFHDASWQPAFGGSLYTTIGSHGCINMPVDKAAALYSMLSIGTPVIMHY